NARGRSATYPYFICLGRQRDADGCNQRALNIAGVVEAIEHYYAHVQLSDDLRLQTEQVILEQVVSLRENNVGDRNRLVTRQRQLLDERRKLLEAHYAGAIPLELLKTEQDRITTELDNIEQRLDTTELKFETVEQRLKQAYALIGNLHQAYLDASPRTRRLLNQALFERFVIDDTEGITGTFREPFDLLMEAAGKTATQTVPRHPKKPRGPIERPRGLSYESLVDLGGLEP
ncbi:MAG: hypothetical protein ACKVUT_09940, partial [Gaiella sp.]